MRVLFVLTNLQIGGAQVFALRLAQQLKKQFGIDALIYDAQPDYREIFDDDIQIFSFSKNHLIRKITWKINGFLTRIGFKNFQYQYNVFQLKKIIKKYGIQIINSHMSFADNIVFDAIKDNRNVRWIITTHGEYELYKNTPFINELIKKLDARCNHLIYTADKNILTSDLKKTKVPKTKIYIGVNALKEYSRDKVLQDLNVNQNDFIFCMISRGIQEKGWEIAIEAFRKLNFEFPSTTLLLIGNGEYLKNLVNKFNHPKIKLIQLETNVLEYTKYIPISDAGILPTYYAGESVPTVIAEFIMSGVPVIASDIGEIKNMIIHENQMAGVLIPVENKHIMIENLYLQMKNFLENKPMYETLKKNTISAGKKFDISNIAKQYHDIFYKELLKKQ